MGWTFLWASSLDSDFNFDFETSITEEQQREGSYEYNYRRGIAPQLPSERVQIPSRATPDGLPRALP